MMEFYIRRVMGRVGQRGFHNCRSDCNHVTGIDLHHHMRHLEYAEMPCHSHMKRTIQSCAIAHSFDTATQLIVLILLGHAEDIATPVVGILRSALRGAARGRAVGQPRNGWVGIKGAAAV